MRLHASKSVYILSLTLLTMISTVEDVSCMDDIDTLNGIDKHQQPSVEKLMMSDEKRLIKFLLNNYDSVGVHGRPVVNTSDTIRVGFGLALVQILDLDEKNQVLTTNVWNRYTWNDILLTWTPEVFGGIDTVRVPVAKIWTPDIVLYNYADSRLKEQRETMAVVSSDGAVLWIPPAIFKSTCYIDITNFPFDEQECRLKFGSWTYDGFKLDISFYDGTDMVDISDYVKSNEWELIEHPGRRNVRYYPCCSDKPFPDLTFTVRLRRMSVFYNYILIFPCALLSVLTLVIFWLPPESPAKILLGMNVFVAFFVLLVLLADVTPPAASSIPLIGAYFCMNMVLITLSTFLAVIMIQTHLRGDRTSTVPSWLRRLTIYGLARVLCASDVLEQVCSARKSCETSLPGIPAPPSRTPNTVLPRTHHLVQPQSVGSETVAAGHSQKRPLALLKTLPPRLRMTSLKPDPVFLLSDPGNERIERYEPATSAIPLSSHDETSSVHGEPYIPMVPVRRRRSSRYHPEWNKLTGLTTTAQVRRHYPSAVTDDVKQSTPHLVISHNSASGLRNARAIVGDSSAFEKFKCEAALTEVTCVDAMMNLADRERAGGLSRFAEWSLSKSPSRTESRSRWSRAVTGDLREIRRLLKAYSTRLATRDAKNLVEQEWRLVARVLDRFFFVTYCSAVIISLAVAFPRWF